MRASAGQMASVLDQIAEHVTGHRTTIVFVNTRRLAERLAHKLGERLGDDVVAAHHGSLYEGPPAAGGDPAPGGQLEGVGRHGLGSTGSTSARWKPSARSARLVRSPRSCDTSVGPTTPARAPHAVGSTRYRHRDGFVEVHGAAPPYGGAPRRRRAPGRPLRHPRPADRPRGDRRPRSGRPTTSTPSSPPPTPTGASPASASTRCSTS